MSVNVKLIKKRFQICEEVEGDMGRKAEMLGSKLSESSTSEHCDLGEGSHSLSLLSVFCKRERGR